MNNDEKRPLWVLKLGTSWLYQVGLGFYLFGLGLGIVARDVSGVLLHLWLLWMITSIAWYHRNFEARRSS